MWYVTAHSSAHMRCTHTHAQLNKPGLFGVKIAESFSLVDKVLFIFYLEIVRAVAAFEFQIHRFHN